MTHTPRRILIVRTSALGDVARTVPALAQLAHTYRQASIDWLVHEQYADVITAHRDLHAAIGFPRSRVTALPKLIRRLRKTRYDLAIDLEGQARSALVTRLCGAPLRVGYANAREAGRLAYNRTAYVSPMIHAVNRMLTLLHATGLTSRSAPVDMTLHIPPDTHVAAPAQGYVAIAPTARWRSKCWPLDRFIDIAKRLRAAGHRIVVLASPGEQAYVQPLVNAAQADYPKTSIAQLMAMIARARLLLCNDSAALHIAVGLGCPVVALFGPTDPARVGPYNQPHAVIQPPDIRRRDMHAYRRHRDDQSLIARIPIDAVWQRIESHLVNNK